MITQVGLLPIFLAVWGVHLYGEWLVLFALSAYFSTVAEAGITQVVANDMTISFAKNQRKEEILTTFQSAWLFVSTLSLLVAGAVAIGSGLLGVAPTLRLSLMPEEQARQILLCTLVTFIIGLQQGIMQSALRAVGRFAEGSFGYNLSLLFEAGTIALALVLGAPPEIVATLILIIRFAALGISITMLRQFAPWLRQGLAHATASEMRRLLLPSLAMLGIPAGNAAMMQGLIMILNGTVGSSAVVLFSTTRTMTRFVIQAISWFSFSSWPEISRLYGAGRNDRLSSYLTHGTQLAIILAAPFGIVVVVGAPVIFRIWTVGRIEPDHALVVILMIGAIATTLRAFPDTLVFATNRHLRYGGLYFVVCLTAAIASYPASLKFGLSGAAVAVTAAEIVLLVSSFTRALEQVGEGFAPLRRVCTALPPINKLFKQS